MGELITCTPFQRNAIGATILDSARRSVSIIRTVREIERGEVDGFYNKAAQEHFNDSRLALGTVGGNQSQPTVTELGNAFEVHYEVNPGAAWQWLLIRSAWATYFPNSSNSTISRTAEKLGFKVNLFDSILRTLWHLQARKVEEQAIRVDELLTVLSDDINWQWSIDGILEPLLAVRETAPNVIAGSTMLEIEKSIGAPRDSLNTFLVKLMRQTGLVILEGSPDGAVKHWQIRLDPRLWSDNHLRTMFLHVINYPLGDAK